MMNEKLVIKTFTALRLASEMRDLLVMISSRLPILANSDDRVTLKWRWNHETFLQDD